MAESSYPFDAQDTTETQYSRLFRELIDSGVWDSSDGPSLRVDAGTGLSVDVQPGKASVRGHAYDNNSVLNLTLTGAATSPKIAYIVLRLDPSVDSIVAAVLYGLEGAGDPALTQTDTGVYELLLARVTIQPSATDVAGDVEDKRTFVSARTGVWTNVQRPAAPRIGKLGYNLDTQAWEFWSGASWKAIYTLVQPVRPFLRLTKSVSQTIVPNFSGGETVCPVVSFDTEEENAGGFTHTGTTWGFIVAPKTGPYRITAGAAWNGGDIANAYRLLRIQSGQSGPRTEGSVITSNPVPFRADDVLSDTVVSGDIYLNAGDTFWVEAYHSDKGVDGIWNTRSILPDQGVGIFLQVSYEGEL